MSERIRVRVGEMSTSKRDDSRSECIPFLEITIANSPRRVASHLNYLLTISFQILS